MIYQELGLSQRSLNDYGFRTKKNTKPLLVGGIQSALWGEGGKNGLTIRSPFLASELGAFTDEFEAAKGFHDDLVMALGLALWGLQNFTGYANLRQRPSEKIIPSASGLLPFDDVFGNRRESRFGYDL